MVMDFIFVFENSNLIKDFKLSLSNKVLNYIQGPSKSTISRLIKIEVLNGIVYYS